MLTAEERMIKKAMKALEARTVMPVKWRTDCWVVGPHDGDEYVIAFCPRCGIPLYSFDLNEINFYDDSAYAEHLYLCCGEMHFCPNCGQKLSWKYAEEDI